MLASPAHLFLFVSITYSLRKVQYYVHHMHPLPLQIGFAKIAWFLYMCKRVIFYGPQNWQTALFSDF